MVNHEGLRDLRGLPGPGGPDSAALAAFRLAAERVARAATGPGDLRRLVAGESDLDTVLDALPVTAQPALAVVESEVEAFRPSARSNARTPADLVRILLLQQIDVLWWSGGAPFRDDAAVAGTPELVALAPLRRAGALGFRYAVSPRTLPDRARRYAWRHWDPDRSPRSSGLSYPVARPAVIGLLGDVATRFALAAPAWRGGLWVNCLVRSQAVQQHLRDLGYSAFPRSSHCTGWAADVEMEWLARRGGVAVVEALRGVLRELRDEGRINVIDEGQAWHVCLSPAWAAHYEARFSGAVGGMEVDLPCAG